MSSNLAAVFTIIMWESRFQTEEAAATSKPSVIDWTEFVESNCRTIPQPGNLGQRSPGTTPPGLEAKDTHSYHDIF